MENLNWDDPGMFAESLGCAGFGGFCFSLYLDCFVLLVMCFVFLVVLLLPVLFTELEL